MQIIIHKLLWQLHAPTQQAANKGQKLAAELSHSSAFLAALEARLSELGIAETNHSKQAFKVGQKGSALAEDHIVIQKLELDLGKLPESSSAAKVQSVLLQKLGEVATKLQLVQTANPLHRTPLAQSLAAQAANFFATGNLPSGWPSGMRTHTQVAAWLGNQIKQNPTLAADLHKNLLETQGFLQALTSLPTLIYLQEIARLRGFSEAHLKKALQLFALLEASSVSEWKQRANRLMWQYMLAANEAKAESLLTFGHEWLEQALPTMAHTEAAKAKKWMVENGNVRAKKPREFTAFEKEEGPQKPMAHQKSESGYFVQNAGLVLIAPFLPAFFEATGVALHKELINPGKAIAFLAALDLGAQGWESASSTLYKVLCGWQIDEVMPTLAQLSEAEETTADELLREVIGHWAVLKNTGPDGLRSAFFWRDGILTKKDNGWLFKVETKAQDVLLGSLPWSISIVKLPWMDEPLHVDWI